MADPLIITVLPDSTGKNVAGTKGQLWVNGVAFDVHIQQTVPADDAGNPLPYRDIKQALDDLLAEAKVQTEILLRILKGTGIEDSSREDVLDAMRDDYTPLEETTQ